MRGMLSATSDSELATMLGLGRSAVSQWRKRGAVPDSAMAKAKQIDEHLRRFSNSSAQLKALPQHVLTHARALAIAYIYRQTSRGPDHIEEGLLQYAAAFDMVTLAASAALRTEVVTSGLGITDAFGTMLIDGNLEPAINKELIPSLLPQ